MAFERELRDLSFVPRWSIVRTVRNQSVAEHSFYVAIYAQQIAEILEQPVSSALLRRALWHDMDEVFTGDIPGPAKRALFDAKKVNGRLSDKADSVFGSSMPKTATNVLPEIMAIVKAADVIEELMFLLTDQQLGNASLRLVLDDVKSRVETALGALYKHFPPHRVEILQNEIDAAAFRHVSGFSAVQL